MSEQKVTEAELCDDPQGRLEAIVGRQCSALNARADGASACKHGHFGPGMHVCRGSRYPDGMALAPCEREDLMFDGARQRVTWALW